MGRVEDRHARRLVDAAALHAHEAVLDHVDPPDAVAAADLVQLVDDFECREPLAVTLTGKPDSNPIVTFSSVGGFLRARPSCRTRPTRRR